MHSAKGGRRGHIGEGSGFASCSMVSVSMVAHVLVGKGSESRKQTSGCSCGRWQARQPAEPVWCRVLHPGRAVLTRAHESPVFSGKKYSSFSELRTLSSSGNHVSLVLTLMFPFHRLLFPLLVPF
ncbi:unnamed protein product [Pipistrellus nathusii]|uniref:Uncharacterized protein n=1 Tax=Pipistrellus nathusii TaxID=59473 RepID=A0ABP0A2A2_PIPNA